MTAPAGTNTPGPMPIGGFFELHECPAADGPSVLDSWTAGRPYAAFVNARSALGALAAMFPDARIWAPAFLCADLLEAVASDRVRFYPVRSGFEADLAVVDADAKPGDLVVVVAYFGLAVAERIRDFARRRSDLVIVEDRAQALGPGLPACGRYALYSPRKLLGVADGGILVSLHPEAVLPQPASQADAEALWRAPLLRSADPAGLDNGSWHAANQAKERAMTAAPQAATERSLAILANAPLAPLVQARLANWRALDGRLRRWSALTGPMESPPLGYVLRLDPAVRARLLDALHAQRIFAAVHWPRIAAPAEAFPREASWTRELLTLPCDHRYGATEMTRIADAVVEHLG